MKRQDLPHDELHGECPAVRKSIKTCCMTRSTVMVQPCPRRVETCCTKVSGPDVESIRMSIHKAYVETRRTKK